MLSCLSVYEKSRRKKNIDADKIFQRGRNVSDADVIKCLKMLTFISIEEIEEMEKSEFNLRAFSWRGRKTIVRNLKLFEEKSIQEAKDADK